VNLEELLDAIASRFFLLTFLVATKKKDVVDFHVVEKMLRKV